jgi:hypothetical protein
MENSEKKETANREISATEFVHDSCEYVVFEGNNSLLRYGAATHKGNCKFCLNRLETKIKNNKQTIIIK